MTPRPRSFRSLLYRYWFFGWMFRDVARGTTPERDAALRHNVERARWLPTYMRRWAALGLAAYGVGLGLEWIGLAVAAPVAFVATCLAAPVLAVASTTWWLLRGPRSAYVRRPFT